MQKQKAIGALLCALVLLVSGCGREAANPSKPAEEATQEPASEAADNAAAAVEDSGDVAASELAGTSWQLVKIQSMNDTEQVPDDSSKYTIAFGAEGDASIRADCNRGTGSYTSEGPSQLQFGLIASTKAMCPPDSLYDEYMAQFEWVRSYVLEDGHLFLATMADGAIIEFAPMVSDDE